MKDEAQRESPRPVRRMRPGDVTVVFSKQYSTYYPGERAVFSKATADKLEARGVACDIKKPKLTMVAPAEEAMTEEVEEEVEEVEEAKPVEEAEE